MELNALERSKSALSTILFESVILQTDSIKNNKASAVGCANTFSKTKLKRIQKFLYLYVFRYFLM